MWTHHTRQHLAERSLTDRKHRKLQDSELLLLYPTRSHLSVSAIGPNTPFQPEELCGESFKLQIGQREEAGYLVKVLEGTWILKMRGIPDDF